MPPQNLSLDPPLAGQEHLLHSLCPKAGSVLLCSQGYKRQFYGIKESLQNIATITIVKWKADTSKITLPLFIFNQSILQID